MVSSLCTDISLVASSLFFFFFLIVVQQLVVILVFFLRRDEFESYSVFLSLHISISKYNSPPKGKRDLWRNGWLQGYPDPAAWGCWNLAKWAVPKEPQGWWRYVHSNKQNRFSPSKCELRIKQDLCTCFNNIFLSIYLYFKYKIDMIYIFFFYIY